jgi:hypothetical protein
LFHFYFSLLTFIPIHYLSFLNEIALEKRRANGNLDLTAFTEKITKLSRSKINRQNRTQHRKVELHRYSQLLDFDRLMHLISLILEHPGIGNLQQTDPQLLENILGQKTNFNNSLITLLMKFVQSSPSNITPSMLIPLP